MDGDGLPALFFGLYLGFIGLMLLASVAGIGLSIWVLVDAIRRPDWQFDGSGQNKTLWIVLSAVSIAACQFMGIVVGGIYLLSIRKKLDVAVPPPYVPAPPPGWPGGPSPPGWPGTPPTQWPGAPPPG